MSFTLPTSKLTYYHTFSKLPVEDTLPLGSAINKAGHTVSATEVWTSEIPYFGKLGSADDITTKVTPYAKKNDMVQITSGADKDKVFRRNGVDKENKVFSELWELVPESELVDGAKFKNANDEEVLVYHKRKKLELLTESNNANITSKNNASRLWVGEDNNRRLVDQFVGVTDRSLNGLASVAYAPVIEKGTTVQVAGTHYYDYCVSGTILWAAANTTDSYITCFEYIGSKVSVSIENLQAAIDAVQGTIENGVVSSIRTSADAENAGFEIDDSEPTSPIINFTKGEVAADSDALVTGADVWNYITELHSVPQLRIVIVEEPADDWTKTEGLIIEKNTIYLVNDKASNPALSGSYIEYLAYAKKDGTIVTEQIGSTKIDLAEYAKDAEVVKSIATANGVSGRVENNVATITVQDGTTDQKGIVKLDNTIADSTSETTAVTPKAVKEYAQKSLTVKDGRETVTENDLWGTTATLDSDGVLSVIHNSVDNPNLSEKTPWSSSITKVEDNKAYTSSGFYANVQTDKIKNGSYMFRDCNDLETFQSDLSSLLNGKEMFRGGDALKSFSSDLSSLLNAENMFYFCTNFSSFNANLPNLINGSGMFGCCFFLDSFSSKIPSLMNGYGMFSECSDLTSFTSDLPNLTNGERMFEGCKKLKTFTFDLGNLTNGEMMFTGCTELEKFETTLPNLTNGNRMLEGVKLIMFTSDLPSLLSAEYMFNSCAGLTTFISDLPCLEDGEYMFHNCNKLSLFESKLPSLINGNIMFYNCTNLTTFATDLSNLINGSNMFGNCINLVSFTADLSNLIRGAEMFGGCKLDAKSIMYIVDTINDITAKKKLYQDGTIPYVEAISYFDYSAPKGFMSDGKYVWSYKNPSLTIKSIKASNVGELTLGINVTNDSATIAQQLEDFAKEAEFNSWADLEQAFVDKGWTHVSFQYNGNSDSASYDLRNREQVIPCPIYAKLEEVFIPSEEELKQNNEYINIPHYEYTSQDGTKFFNIYWYHKTNGINEEYTSFDSLEAAIEHFNVIPKD